MTDEPQTPFSAMAQVSISHHEMYTSWIEAGFTPEQAFELLRTVIVQVLGGAKEC